MKRLVLPLSLLVALACGPKKAPTPAAASGNEVAAAPVAAPAVPEAAPAAPTAEPPRPPVVTPASRVNDAVLLLQTPTEDAARAALEQLKNLSSEVPDLGQVPYNMGLAYMRLGDITNARRQFLRATDVNGQIPEAWLNLGVLAEREGDFDRALRAYESGRRENPDDPNLVANEIGVLRRLGRYADAEARAKEAIARNSKNLNAYLNLGLVYLDQGKVPLAVFIYERANMQIPGADKNATLRCNLGRTYMALDREAVAREEFEEALKLDPTMVQAMMFLSDMHLKNHDWNSAVVLLENARTLEPENPAIYNNLGITYRGLGRFEESRKAYERALDLQPNNLSPYLNLAILLGDHVKAYDEAIAMLDTYKRKGGTETALAASWETDIRTRKEKAAVMEAKRKKAEDARKRAQDDEARKASQAAEEARQKALEEEAARNAPPPPAPTEAVVTPPVAPAPAAPAPEAPAPVVIAPVVPSATATSMLGNSCQVVDSCGDPSLQCAHDRICRPAGTQGTLVVGVGCVQDTDCAVGLSCQANSCAAPAATPSVAPWGAAPAEPPPPTSPTPWGN